MERGTKKIVPAKMATLAAAGRVVAPLDRPVGGKVVYWLAQEGVERPDGARTLHCGKCGHAHYVTSEPAGVSGTLQFEFKCQADGCGHKTGMGLA